jgi:glucokinase-like ROK family protein
MIPAMVMPAPSLGRVRLPDDHLDTLHAVIESVRSTSEITRPEIVRVTGLGRNVVAQRVAELAAGGLVEGGDQSISTGGRAARAVRLRASAGHILVAELGATSITVGLSDLGGGLLDQVAEPSDITTGPEPILARVAELFESLVERHRPSVWGVGIGLPGPVEFGTGEPVAPPIMPGWDRFDVRRFFSSRFDAPTWVDNDVNVMAQGELRDGLAKGEKDFIYVKVGTGIGAGLVSGGKLHRGAQGCAGDIGHVRASPDSTVVCRCGQTGCLEAIAGGAALAAQGEAAARSGESSFLSRLTEPGRPITAADVGQAVIFGDAHAVELVSRSARLVGETLAGLVNFFNPSLVLLGGGVSEIGDLYLAGVRQMVLRRSLPLATRSLRIERSPLGNTAGLKGAAFMAIDELFSREAFGIWFDKGSPVGMADLPVGPAGAAVSSTGS